MPEKTPLPKKKLTADWLVGGILTKIGDTVDRFTGRRWVPSSSLAASELIDRIKKLLDAEAKEIPGKGIVVPHNIKLKMQWDKFSDDAEDAIAKLETELLTAAADHINDSLYYTYAPLTLQVKADYFTEGVILFAGFDKFDDDDREVELNVTVPAINVADAIAKVEAAHAAVQDTYVATFQIKDVPKEKRLEFPSGGRLSVGRTGENELQIDDASVSKIHASLAVDAEGHLSVADTGSTNGTFINDERISYGKATPVEVNDRVRFGLITVGFEYVPRPPAPEPEEELSEGPSDETVEIDGFEFKQRVSPETTKETSPAMPIPAVEKENQEDGSADEIPKETSPAVPIPDETLRIVPTPVENANREEETATTTADETRQETSPAIPIPHQSLIIEPIPTEKDSGENSIPKKAETLDDEFKTRS